MFYEVQEQEYCPTTFETVRFVDVRERDRVGLTNRAPARPWTQIRCVGAMTSGQPSRSEYEQYHEQEILRACRRLRQYLLRRFLYT